MKKLIVLLSVALCLGCVKDNIESVSVSKPELAKIVALSDDNVQGSMIVCFDEQATTRVEAGVTRSGATRSGIEKFDGVLEQIGAIRMERIFVSNRFEERLRSEGMHRWYVVYFDQDADLNKAAEMFAGVAEVELVQYNARMQHITEPTVADVSTTTAEQSNALANLKPYPAFNDPDLGRQWNYINTGHTAVFSGAKKGADANLGDAWDITGGDPRVIVAVVDGMVKYDHPDLADNMWVNSAEKNGAAGVDDDNNGYIDDIYGVNFVTYTYPNGNKETELKEGYNDHGTHVAGTVAATNNNGRGGCGVAGGTGKGDGARLMSCQVFYQRYPSNEIPVGQTDPDPQWTSGSEVATSRAFQYAADNGAAIAQCSYGYGSKMISDAAYAKGSAEKSAIDYFIKYGGGDVMIGGLPIFAAGNNQLNYASYPGAYRDFVCVTAMSCDFTPAYYTNFGPGSNIAAPGGDYLQKYYTDRTGELDSGIYSTTFIGGTYGIKWGTSMACPHVSGIAALAISHSLTIGKKLTAIDLRNILLGSTHDIDRFCVGTKTGLTTGNMVETVQLGKFKGKMGVGYIDAFKALMHVQGIPCVTVSTGVKQNVDIADAIGGNPATLTFVNGGVSMSQAEREKLGVEGDVIISATGKLQIKCNKTGSAVVKISFIAGGTEVGTDEATGGMVVTREVAILSRGFASNGGWL